jgi:hypothetical protein
MRSTTIFVIAMAGLAVGACNTTSAVEQRARDEARCHGYGFHTKTDAFSKCLLQLDLDRSADRRSRNGYGIGYPYRFAGRGWYWGPW